MKTRKIRVGKELESIGWQNRQRRGDHAFLHRAIGPGPAPEDPIKGQLIVILYQLLLMFYLFRWGSSFNALACGAPTPLSSEPFPAPWHALNAGKGA